MLFHSYASSLLHRSAPVMTRTVLPVQQYRCFSALADSLKGLKGQHFMAIDQLRSVKPAQNEVCIYVCIDVWGRS